MALFCAAIRRDSVSLLKFPFLSHVHVLYYYYYYYYSFFLHQLTLMVFHWILSDNKSPQISRALLSILAILNNAVVWVVSSCPPTSKSSSLFSNSLVTVPKAPTTTGIIITCMFHSFFNSLVRSYYYYCFSNQYLSLFHCFRLLLISLFSLSPSSSSSPWKKPLIFGSIFFHWPAEQYSSFN